jgi:hypothetical protein
MIIENSSLPEILSAVSPINVWAFSFGPFVWCEGEANERLRNHETIHFQQQVELLFVLQWVLYMFFWLWGVIFGKGDSVDAYFHNPFEREAYDNDGNLEYLETRPFYNWLQYIGS